MQVGYTYNDPQVVLVAPISQMQRKELSQDMKANGLILPAGFNQKLEGYSSLYSCKPFYVYKLPLYKVSLK